MNAKLQEIARARRRPVRPEVRREIARLAGMTAERRQLCIDAAVLKERFGRAGLYKTLHAMDVVTTKIGYEVAELEVGGKR